MKVGIFGVGAIGSAIIKSLTGEDEYSYFNRASKEKIELLFEEEVFTKAIKLSKSKEVEELDWLIICIKEYQFKEAKEDLKRLIGKKTKIAIIRNGLHLKEPLLAYTAAENMLECMIDCPVQQTKDGKYIQYSNPKITTAKTNLSTAFEQLFAKEKIELKQVDDYLTTNWKKIIESSALGGILALSGETIWIFKDKNILNLYKKIVAEGILVARLEGAKIEEDFVAHLLGKIKTYPATKGSSMLTDRLNGKPIEINAKNGVISKLGKKHQVKTELNDLISLLLKFTNLGKQN